MRRCYPLLLAVYAALALVPAVSRAGALDSSSSQNNTLCMRSIVQAEHREAIPARLLGAVALAESGRPGGGGSAIVAWPWTVMAEGTGRYFETKAEAIAEVAQLRARGVRNIDVGCMQVNLMYHPDAFPSIEAAFDPAQNVAYGASLLKSLRQSSGSWTQAVAQYHTQDSARGRDYMARVMRIWGSPASREAETAIADSRPAKPAPLEGASAASLMARAAAADTKPSPMIRLDQRPPARPWTDVVRARTKFAEWLAQRQGERRDADQGAIRPADRDPS
jgi:Transglycosylase SLT domain